MTNRILVLAVALLAFASPSVLLAADDPSIEGALRKGIQESMAEYIHDHTVKGIYWRYDVVSGEVLELQFQKLHKGIERKGNFYVSCADFTDPDGKKLDLDFLVVAGDHGLPTVQAIVHKIGNETRAYDLNGSSHSEHPEHPKKAEHPEHPKKAEHPKSDHPK